MNDSIFSWFSLAAENLWLYGGTFLLVLGLLVFVHELGHYAVARWCGVKVESFSIGFGKELFGFTDKKGTRWKFSLIPLGGYVQMFGFSDPASTKKDETVKDEETEEQRPFTEEEKKVAFFSQPVSARAAIVFAGPAVNYIFAIIIFALVFTFYGQPATPTIISGVIGDSAASRAGFKPHDEILSIDDKKIRKFEDIRRAVTIGLNTEKTFKVLRDGEEVELSAVPDKLEEKDRFGFSHSRGILGVISQGSAISLENIMGVNGVSYDDIDQVRNALKRSLDRGSIAIEVDRGEEIDTIFVDPLRERNEDLWDPEAIGFDILDTSSMDNEIIIEHGIVSATEAAVRESIDVTVNTFEALWQMVTGTRSAKELGGIIRIGAIAGDMAKSGMIALATFTALLSINLGLINLFPIPVLDGGHLVFYAVEAVKGSPISERVQEYAFRIGFALLIGLMLFANLNDIMQLILS